MYRHFALPGAAAVLAAAVSAWAQAPAEGISAKVGGRVISGEELVARYRALPSSQRETYSKSGGLRAFLEQVMVPERLLLAAAERDESQSILRDRALRMMLEAKERQLAKAPGAAAQEAFLSEHQRFFQNGPSLELRRILLKTKSQAADVIRQLSSKGMQQWGALCRERSVDAATSMRAGSLGFVFENGQSSYPEVRVSPQLYAAAAKVADGKLVPEPIAEGTSFAVVWRLSSRPASEDPQSRATARRLLTEKASIERQTSLRQRLREQYVAEVEPSRIGLLQGWFESRKFAAAPSAPLSWPSKDARIEAPIATERGLR